MINRRTFIKSGLRAGFALGSAGLLKGCGGLTRNEMPALKTTGQPTAALDSQARAILYHASLAPSGHNSQPWRVRIERPGSWMIMADDQRRLPAVDPNSRELLLSIGAFVEDLGWRMDDHHQPGADGSRFDRHRPAL